MAEPVGDYRRRRQRSQSMVEFAIVAPLLLVLLFAVVDFGRVIYTYITLNQAVNEGVRVAIRDSPLLPSNLDVEAAVRTHAVDVTLANPCPNGPITTAVPPPN
ncbi:MAG TPA: TadE/TadG family type IV pilus assembly protein, partial [Candidatus Dormibacteraeota bacterium]|nr:TadE/TadG family type IV pilus assembly protein [Candidatus Dormibacteraeota bacterium]